MKKLTSLAFELAARPLRFSPVRFLSGVRWTDGKLLLACLGIGFLVRLIPELLAWPLPIGFDTVYYAVVAKSGVVWAHWSQFFTSSWLLYALIVPAYSVFQGDPLLLLKVVGPLLFGLNVAGVYWFARRGLGWSLRMSVVAGVFFALQLASLRISWDLLRNALGLGILLFAFSYVKEVGSRRGFALFTSLSLLSVFAHEYAAVILLFTVLGLVVWKVARREAVAAVKPLLLGVLPALSVFAVGMFLRFYPVRFVVPSNVAYAGDAVTGQTGVFFLVDYLRVQSSVDSYLNYASLALSVGLLFAVLFLPYFFLVVKGFFKNRILELWTGLLLVGAFGCLVVPFSALLYWHRWMFMLVYPFTFFAVSGIARLVSKNGGKRFGVSRLFTNKVCAVTLLLTFGLGVSYLATPVLMSTTGAAVPYVTSISTYFSVAPTVPYQDADSVIESMNWLNVNMGASSCVVLQQNLLDWGQLYLDKSHEIVYFANSPDAAVATASSNGFSQLYFVGWNEPIGWSVDSVPDNFVSVQDFGRISVYVSEV